MTAAPTMRLQAVTARFRRPAVVGCTIELQLVAGGTDTTAVKLVADGMLLATFDLSWEPAAPQVAQRPARPQRAACRRRTAEELSTAAGVVDVQVDPVLLATLLPELSRRSPHGQIAQLIATSRLVGMECPGLDSIFGELRAEFTATPGFPDRLEYAVTAFNKRYRTATMTIRSPGLSGTIQAFVRPEPVVQPGSATLRARVAAGAFAGQRALVVGGSRGIGEVTAKLLALGGADVRLTYARGQADADAVVADIVAAGGRAAALAYDVTAPGSTILGGLAVDWPPTHLYYFPTPPLTAGSVGSFSPASFATFSQFYVTGFAAAVLGLRSATPKLRGVFYPSTVALDGPPGSMAEYASAKAAGEALCDYFAKHLRETRFHRTRLPRISTDLTASLLPVPTEDVVDVMLDRLHAFTNEC